MKQLGVIASPPKLPEDSMVAEYERHSSEINAKAHSINLMRFMQDRLNLQSQSYASPGKLDGQTITAYISAKIEPFTDTSFRFSFVMFEENTPYLLSKYFDKIIFDVGKDHFEWNRTADHLQVDAVEYIINQSTDAFSVSFAAYPDPPVQYFIVPDHLQEATGTSCDFFAHIMKSIISYISKNKLSSGSNVLCDEILSNAFHRDEVPIGELPYVVRSHLLPLHPISNSFTLSKEHPLTTFTIQLPNIRQLPQIADSPLPSSLSQVITEFADTKEVVDILSAIARNPVEAIEAEITGHTTDYELVDENNPDGPKVESNELNAALRSTTFYWQPWVSGQANTFLEENKLVHARYPGK